MSDPNSTNSSFPVIPPASKPVALPVKPVEPGWFTRTFFIDKDGEVYRFFQVWKNPTWQRMSKTQKAVTILGTVSLTIAGFSYLGSAITGKTAKITGVDDALNLGKGASLLGGVTHQGIKYGSELVTSGNKAIEETASGKKKELTAKTK